MLLASDLATAQTHRGEAMTDASTASRTMTATIGNAPGGKYLTFMLGEEVFGVEIIKIQEIIRMQKVTRVPRVRDYVRGVINLRGKIIPIIELRRKFGMEPQADTDKTCIIVFHVNGEDGVCIMGIIIDEVKEVQNIGSENIEPPDFLSGGIGNDFIMGIGKVGGEVKILLDIDRILTTAELAQLAKVE